MAAGRNPKMIVGVRTSMAAAATERIDPRITRSTQALESAIVELAAERPVSQITVAELADRAAVTRATFYNRYGSPLELLIQVLNADLERAHRAEDKRRAEGGYPAAQLLRMSIEDVAKHVERFKPVYQHALRDPADRGVYEALVRHFAGYAQNFIARATHPDLPGGNHHVVGRFLAHGFAGAIEAWVGDDSLTTEDLVEASAACAPIWWV
jgi:AcrR family transcriptional regulator